MQAPDPAGLRLLLVEDEYLIALYLAELLEEQGARVLGPAGCVSDALALIDREPDIDAAILDVNLAGEAVFPVADALRARHVPFAFASGYDPSLMPDRFREVDVCVKPIDGRTVGAVLGRLRPVA